MRLAIVIIGILILSGCATTTPRKPLELGFLLSERWHEYAKTYSDREDDDVSEPKAKKIEKESIDDLFGSCCSLGIIDSMSLTEREHFTSSFGRSMLGKPTRVYKQITTLSIYDSAKIIMDSKGFDMPLIDKLKFPIKVSCCHAQQYCHERISDGFAWHWEKYTKIIIQCGFGNQSSYIRKGKMVTTFNDVPPVWRFLKSVGINPND